MKRRHLLRSGATLGTSLPFWSAFQRQAAAQGPAGQKKLIFVFQRGGNDGVNTVIPRGDSQYSTSIRPDIFIPEASGIDTGNGFAQFHPALQPMMDIFGAGDLAAVHRVGYRNQSRSHFDSQDYWERGAVRDSSVEDGMFYRHLAATGTITPTSTSLAAVGLSNNAITSLRGEIPVPNFNRVSDFDFRGSTSDRRAFSDAVSTLFGGTPYGGRTPSALVHATGTALSNTLASLSAARGEYTPENGAEYPDSDLGRKLREAALLLKRTNVSIIGVDRGGHDTHRGQGGVNGEQADNLNDLALCFDALSKDLAALWDDLLIVTMTEFGRTSIQNGSGGTDHAESSAMFLAGGGVNGGVYNCDTATWGDAQDTLFSERDRYVARRTDFRAVFWEIFEKHFGDALSLREQIIPGYALAQLDDPGGMAPLGVLA